MKLAITGSRTIDHCEQLIAQLEQLPITHLMHGGAEGIDQLAAAWAISKGIAVTEFKPDYATHGDAAPHVRNSELVKQADQVLACWDGKSKGTASTIAKARKAGKLLTVVTVTSQLQTQLSLW